MDQLDAIGPHQLKEKAMQEMFMHAVDAYAQALGRAVQIEENMGDDAQLAQAHEAKRQARDAVEAMVRQLVKPGINEEDAEQLNQAVEMLQCMAEGSRLHGDSSTHMGASSSAHAVQKLACTLLASQRCTGCAVQQGYVPAGAVTQIQDASHLPEIKDMLNAPQTLNNNDRAFWVLGWNECRDAAKPLIARIAELETREPRYTWTGTEADDAMILIDRMDDSLEPERIAQLEKIIPRLAARIKDVEAQLIKEAARTAEEKLRADQMTQQHAMQAKMHAQASAQLAAPLVGQQKASSDWWRKRADEIEAEVARTGSINAMRCFTDMRTLMQEVARPTQQGLDAHTTPLNQLHLQLIACGVVGEVDGKPVIWKQSAIELTDRALAAQAKQGE